MTEQAPELVQTWRFVVDLNRSAAAIPALTAPPNLQRGTAAGATTRPAPAGGGTARAPVSPGGGVRAAGTDRLGNGAFQECSGIALGAESVDLAEGGRNDAMVRRVGKVTLEPIVLRRGMFVSSAAQGVDPALWSWLQATVALELPLPRYDGEIRVLAPDHSDGRPHVVAHWTFYAGLPLRVGGLTLNAITGAVAIEELRIAHQGLKLQGLS